ncbi:hypothetical protein [Salinirubrum litoreum]|uniref:PEP-CTERM protein-sorting domain-containing protein n=1 Tax=Salinirubrum litoreum TaxID=1126234 RepID=A0ABD5RD44_9EURY|nr:hypothetical protein [Salinirubrum litoreum]
MADVRGPSTRRLVLVAVLVGAGLFSTLARILAGEQSPWVLSMAGAFGVMLLIVGQQLWVRTRRDA